MVEGSSPETTVEAGSRGRTPRLAKRLRRGPSDSEEQPRITSPPPGDSDSCQRQQNLFSGNKYLVSCLIQVKIVLFLSSSWSLPVISKLNYLASLYGHADFFAYLESPAWIDFCKANLKSACEKCGSKQNLGVQHKNYGSLCLEKPKDVITLCRECSSDKKVKFDDGLKPWRELNCRDLYFSIMEDEGLVYAYDKTPTKKALESKFAFKSGNNYLWNEKKLAEFCLPKFMERN